MDKDKKWTIVISSLLLGILLILIAYTIFKKFSNTTSYFDYNSFIDNIKQSIDDGTGGVYISNVSIDTYHGTISYTLHNGGQSKDVVAKVGYAVATEWSKFDAEIGTSLAGILGSKVTDKTVFNQLFQQAIAGAKNGLEVNSTHVPVEQSSFIKSLLLSILPTLIMIFLLFLLYRWMMKKNMSMMGAVGDDKNPAQKVKSDKTFKDVAGNKEAIEEISELVDYLKNPKKYELAGARMPHGILLGGPPGTGKTLLAKATAGEANVPFYFISASNFVEMYVGLGAKRVRTVVAEARKNAPAIIFIDELDAIGRTRGSGIGGGHDEREQTLNQLLVEMDGMTKNNGLLFFAATNRTDVLDPALTRPGRFDRTITVGLPDVKERQEILELHAQGKRLSKSIDLAQVARRTPGYSGAQLENVINEASLLAVRGNSDVITRDHIDEAIDRVMAGPAKKNRVISKEELTMVAYHEAGHAVVGIRMPGANRVQKITIIPRGQAGGYNLMTPDEEKYNMNKNELLAVITSFMGGRASEEIIYGKDKISTGASDDISKATKIARKMVTEYGMSDLGPIQYEEDQGSPFLGRDLMKASSFSNQVGHEIDIEVRKIMMEAKDRAIKTIKANMQLLELIKTALLDKETIVAEEIEYIAKNMKLPPKQAADTQKPKVYTLDELFEDDKKDSGKKEDKK